MPWWQVLLIVMIFVFVDGVIVFVVVPALIRESWGAIADTHPAIRKPFDRVLPGGISTPATWRGFQSMSADMINMGWCMHIGVDDWGIHLHPARLGRLFGLKPASVPWEAISPKKRRKRFCTVLIRGVSVKGPTWALGRLWRSDTVAMAP
jgi:hypothetical protein